MAWNGEKEEEGEGEGEEEKSKSERIKSLSRAVNSVSIEQGEFISFIFVYFKLSLFASRDNSLRSFVTFVP